MSPEARPNFAMSPAEAASLHTEQIPEQVFDVFNSLIARDLSQGEATVYQDEVVAELENRGMSRQAIYGNKWLDVEDSYREVGWRVKYDRPVYWGGENFRAYFHFSEPKRER